MSQNGRSDTYIEILLSQQTLVLFSWSGTPVARYPVSTALAGPGEQENSGCTPRGKHYIRAMVGGGFPSGSVFRARRPTGEIFDGALAERFPERDWILSRILWLCGREPGRNRGSGVDTFHRFIYIHGTPDTEPMGIPMSHGCIRMRNADVLELFEQVRPGTDVFIG
jgi:hypothetical protein